MPRTGRGGRRTGTPGTAYRERTDLQVPAMAPTGQQYGQHAAQMAAQRAVPIARPSTDAVPARAASPAAPAPAGPAVMPGQVVPLDAPTQRPGEPLTAGLDVGAGPGSAALGPLGMGGQDVATQLRAIYSRFPNEDLRSLIEILDDDD